MDACVVAEALYGSQDFPDMLKWPIAKVAVLLLDPTRKKCLIEYSSDTKGVWSMIEKKIVASAGNSHGSNQSLQSPYMLQQLAFTEVDRRTGMKRSNLRLLGEDLAYSLSTKRTTAMLFIVEYKQTMNRYLREIPIQELISSMTGPLFVNGPFPKTSSVVEHYHILPYKQILRKWSSDAAAEQHEANRKSKMQKGTRKISTPKQNKQAIKSVVTNSNTSCSTDKGTKNSKRTYEAETAAALNVEDRDGESPVRENYPLISVDVDTSKLPTKPRNTKESAATSGGKIVLQADVQMDNKKTQRQSICDDITPDVFPTKAPSIDYVTKNIILEGQNRGVSEKSGGITENNIDQMYDSLQSIQKKRDDLLHKHHILAELSAQCDMDIQTILSEGKMTQIVKSIIDKYKNMGSNMAEVANSSCSGGDGQTLTTKRIKLREAPLLRNKCQELDEISRDSNWILPRYTVLPSEDGMFQASVHLRGVDFDLSIEGGLRMTPQEARWSAAANMILELSRQAEEEKSEDESTISGVA
ncbi:uncharacterized protein LOC100830098 [Brachypodium distachyon]|nr:uncharacterized protein LOC100830098 [Brachypodium distachyon]KQK07474.1 hypothetical protein BRADI_2g35660v3 [Brachypodium distachyon]|eukprot:XP_010231694.1 uncharacterized protein LOC100830098 [Brachypodium distachyon]